MKTGLCCHWVSRYAALLLFCIASCSNDNPTVSETTTTSVELPSEPLLHTEKTPTPSAQTDSRPEFKQQPATPESSLENHTIDETQLLHESPDKTAAGNPISHQARVILQKMINAYEQADTYEDETEFHFKMKGPLRTRFKRPNQIDTQLANARVVSDGDQQIIYMEPLKKHMIKKAPQEMTRENLFGQGIPAAPLGTISVPLQLLSANQGWNYVLENVTSISVDSAPVDIEGTLCKVIRLERETEDAVIYINQDNSLIRRLEIDLSDSPMMQRNRLSGHFVLDMKNAKIDSPSESFDFTPPEESMEITEMDKLEIPESPSPPP